MNIAIVPASGLGDSLIFHIAAVNLRRMGHTPTTFSNHLPSLGAWVGGYAFAPQPTVESSRLQLSAFDAILLQHDNSPKAQAIRQLPTRVFCFYGSHNRAKHGARGSLDYICNPEKTMVDNLTQALSSWFGPCSADLNLTAPSGRIYRKFPRRLAIHPFSSSPEKNWPLAQFEQAARFFKQEGWEPVFLEQNNRLLCPTLEALATFLYESGAFLGNDSGPGHLASALNIPSCIIGPNQEHMQLWRPGWRPATLALPPRWVGRWRWSRQRWQSFVSTKNVIKTLKTNVL